MLKKVLEISTFFKNNLTRILILLLIITFGFTFRTSTLAKYTALLYDSTSAVASDFFYASDYLTIDTSLHSDNSFDGNDYNLIFSIRNYENSLRYNTTGSDLVYTIYADVYSDIDCTTTSNLFYGSGSYVKTYYGHTDPTRDNVVASSGNVSYCIIKGLDVDDEAPDDDERSFLSAVNSGKGTQNVQISIHAVNQVPSTDTVYLKVRAYILSATEASRLTYKDGIEYSGGTGSYSGEMSAIVALSRGSGNDQVSTDIVQSGRDVTYRVQNKSGDSTSTEIRVYYDSSVLSPRGNNVQYGYDPVKGDYVLVNVSLGGTENVEFIKAHTSDVITSNELYYEQIVRNVGDEPEKYSVASNSNVIFFEKVNNYLTASTKSNYEGGETVYVKADSVTNYKVGTFAVKTTHGNKSVRAVQVSGYEGYYSFTMPSDGVSITVTYVPEIQVGTIDHASILTEPQAAAENTQIIVYVTEQAGYTLKKLKYKGKTSGNETEFDLDDAISVKDGTSWKYTLTFNMLNEPVVISGESEVEVISTEGDLT